MSKKIKRIIIAEDDESISEVMTAILESDDYTVNTAKNSKELFTLLKKYTPHIIFLDVRLGGENGEEIARKLKKDAALTQTALIMLSADDHTEEIAEKVKAEAFLLKPFELEDLLALCRQYTV